jgi:hypothetical protein
MAKRYDTRVAAIGIVGLLVMVSVAGAATSTRKKVVITPKPEAPKSASVTDATVAERVLSARTKADEEALAAYYKAKAAAEEPRIAHFDQLFRAYLQLSGKKVEPMQRLARSLLKAARMSKQRYELLSQAHRTLALEWNEQ